MATLQELQRRRDVLQARAESKREIEQVGRERKKLQEEIKALKNPRTAAFKKNLRKGLILGGRGALKFLDEITRPTVIKRKPAKRKVVRRKTIKRKSPKKRRRR